MALTGDCSPTNDNGIKQDAARKIVPPVMPPGEGFHVQDR
jgi:hypothetical protein